MIDVDDEDDNFSLQAALADALARAIDFKHTCDLPPAKEVAAISQRVSDLNVSIARQLVNALVPPQQHPQQQHFFSASSTPTVICLALLDPNATAAVEQLVRDSLLLQFAALRTSSSRESVGFVASIAVQVVRNLLRECSDLAARETRSLPVPLSFGGGAAMKSICSGSGSPRGVSLGCARLDAMVSPRHRGFRRGQMHEVYGTGGMGKSTWAAQLLLHTLRENPDCEVVAIAAEPMRRERLAQIELAQEAAWKEQQQQKKNANGDDSPPPPPPPPPPLFKRLCTAEPKSVADFEFSARMLLRRQHPDQDIPLIVLDSVAGLVDKSVGGDAETSYTSEAAERCGCIERIGTALRSLAWAFDAAVVVINQARDGGSDAGTVFGRRPGALGAGTIANRPGGGGDVGNLIPALGAAWASFVTGSCVEITRPAGGGVPGSRRRARLVRSSGSAPSSTVEFDLVMEGIVETPLV